MGAEATAKRTTPEFFAAHTVSELWNWSDFDLENEGRLTHLMVYDQATDRYLEISWEALAKNRRRAPCVAVSRYGGVLHVRLGIQ
jgi:anaerobic selenocysteine-containing dehydrogenase